MNTKKNIWIVNHYGLPTAGRHYELAKCMGSLGYNVVFIMSSFDHECKRYLYKESLYICESSEGFKTVFLHSQPSYKKNGVKRILNMFSFCWLLESKKSKIAQTCGTPDFIIASSVHPFVWESGYRIAKKYGAKFVAEIRDIWPLSLIEVQGVSPSHPFVRLLDIVENRAYHRADAIVTTMPFAYKHIVTKGVERDKIHWVPNGISTALVDEVLESDMELPQDLNRFLTSNKCCIYTGSFVPSENVKLLIEAFSYLKDKDIKLVLIGAGQEKDLYIKLIEKYGLQSSVRIYDRISHSLVQVALSKSLCCLAAVHDFPIYKYGLSINKLSDYLYSGKPVIFACGVHSVVNDAGQFVVDPNDAKEMATAIRKIYNLEDSIIKKMGEISKDHIRKNYDYMSVSKKYIDLLNNL